MKKTNSLLVIIVVFFLAVTIISSQVQINSMNTTDEWTGSIRIEGKFNTVWNGAVTISETYVQAKNMDTGETEEFHIELPTVLGALDEASKIGHFSYELEYWPDFDAVLIKSIEDDYDGWLYWVDYVLPMVSVNSYELTDENNEIIIGYAQDWNAHALKISVDKSEVKKNEEFMVTVFNETNNIVIGATVYVGDKIFTTGNEGKVTATISNKGYFDIYSEMDGYVRSEKVNIQVKKKNVDIKNTVLGFLINIRDISSEHESFLLRLFVIYG